MKREFEGLTVEMVNDYIDSIISSIRAGDHPTDCKECESCRCTRFFFGDEFLDQENEGFTAIYGVGILIENLNLGVVTETLTPHHALGLALVAGFMMSRHFEQLEKMKAMFK